LQPLGILNLVLWHCRQTRLLGKMSLSSFLQSMTALYPSPPGRIP
jgi:hypothetical protein